MTTIEPQVSAVHFSTGVGFFDRLLSFIRKLLSFFKPESEHPGTLLDAHPNAPYIYMKKEGDQTSSIFLVYVVIHLEAGFAMSDGSVDTRELPNILVSFDVSHSPGSPGGFYTRKFRVDAAGWGEENGLAAEVNYPEEAKKRRVRVSYAHADNMD